MKLKCFTIDNSHSNTSENTVFCIEPMNPVTNKFFLSLTYYWIHIRIQLVILTYPLVHQFRKKSQSEKTLDLLYKPQALLKKNLPLKNH